MMAETDEDDKEQEKGDEAEEAEGRGGREEEGEGDWERQEEARNSASVQDTLPHPPFPSEENSPSSSSPPPPPPPPPLFPALPLHPPIITPPPPPPPTLPAPTLPPDLTPRPPPPPPPPPPAHPAIQSAQATSCLYSDATAPVFEENRESEMKDDDEDEKDDDDEDDDDEKMALISFESLEEDDSHLKQQLLQKEQQKEQQQREKQQQMQHQLLSFISHNDVENVRRLVAEGVKVNHVDKFYESFGRVALGSSGGVGAAGGGAGGQAYLKKTGGYVPGSEITARTPLCFATKDGLEEIVTILLEAGADVNQHDEWYGSFPIQEAIQGGHLGLFHLLLQHGADIHVKDKLNQTSLHFATRVGNEEMVNTLLERHADVNAVSRSGMTPLHFATRCTRFRDEIVLSLIKSGANVDAVAFKASHVTPLHCAIVKWQVEAVAHLLEAGANPALTDKNGATPLVYAMQQSHSEIARMLLNAGADIDQTNPMTGGTALLAAVDVPKNVDMVKLLVHLGADINKENMKGETPLLKAVENHETDVVLCLVQSGCDVNKQTHQGWSALGMALNLANIHEMSSIVYALLAGGGGGGGRGAEVDVFLTFKRITPLHLAAIINSSKTSILDSLILLGAPLEAVDDEGKSAFRWAAEAGRQQVLERLVEFGYPVFKETWILKKEEEEEQSWTDAIGGLSSPAYFWLRHLASNPLSLLDLTRNQVRRSLDKTIFRRKENVCHCLSSLIGQKDNISHRLSLWIGPETSANVRREEPDDDPLYFLPRKIKNFILFR